MDILKFYQGYLENKNNFFAPSAKKNKLCVFPSVGKEIKPETRRMFQEILSSRPTTRRTKGMSTNDRELITPDTLSLYIDRRKKLSTPVPTILRYKKDLDYEQRFSLPFKQNSTKKKKKSFSDSKGSLEKLCLSNIYNSHKNAEVQT